jgi:hypothetical protein
VRDDGRVASARGRYVALALALLLAATGCGTASSDSPPTGVDELVIPTPSPDPADYVSGIDNPWLAWAPGATWRYRLSGEPGTDLVITVEDATYEIAGVATTPVSRTEPTGEQVVDYFAQDRRGNVWWFGREGVWQAGKDGARAGLAMPATPRVGDGWRAAYGPGVVDVRESVATRDQVILTPAGRYAGVLALDVTDGLAPGGTRRVFYKSGVGMVEEVSIDGPSYLAELTGPPG